MGAEEECRASQMGTHERQLTVNADGEQDHHDLVYSRKTTILSHSSSVWVCVGAVCVCSCPMGNTIDLGSFFCPSLAGWSHCRKANLVRFACVNVQVQKKKLRFFGHRCCALPLCEFTHSARSLVSFPGKKIYSKSIPHTQTINPTRGLHTLPAAPTHILLSSETQKDSYFPPSPEFLHTYYAHILVKLRRTIFSRFLPS
jgi:hypothetical protein